MNTTELTASKALELLKDIPEEDFITKTFTDGQGKCCAIGHLQRLTSQDPTDYSFRNCNEVIRVNPIRKISEEYITKVHSTFADIASVNNEDTVNGYNEDTPKKRVLHLLEDMIKAGY
jgi:hypothetical protein